MAVSYVGTSFAGWQVQPGADTIQGRLEAALGQALNRRTAVGGAGRTDAGVHARAQVAHFLAPAARSLPDLRHTLNALLPKEIRVERLVRAGAGFDARRDAVSKHYRYTLLVVRKPSPFMAPFVGRFSGPPPLLDLMKAAAARLVGEHDFAAFCGSGSAVRTTVRRIFSMDLAARGDTITFDIHGGGFLRHQVRNMVGTLVDVGQGRRSPNSMQELLQKRDRRLAGPTAPAAGLCLIKVNYRPRREE